MTYSLPVYRCRLVRDKSLKLASAKADNPGDIAKIARGFVRGADRELFLVVLLDACNKPCGVQVVSMGTLTASLVHPRETFKPAILAGAAAVVVVHNHPSGDPAPSKDDREVTRRLSQAGRILGIPLLDHVIIGGSRFFSFREHGLLND